jgi:large subunit ribosomal protein L18
VNVSSTRERKKWARRQRRAWHVGNRLFGTKERPRLSIHRSNKHFHCQIIDDAEGKTLASASTLMKDLKGQLKHGGDKKAAALVGEKLAAAAKAAGVTRVIFDRGFYRFHGRVRSFAEAAAKGGLQFLVNPENGPKPPRPGRNKRLAEKPAAAAKPEKKQGKPPKPEGAGKPAAPPPKPEAK